MTTLNSTPPLTKHADKRLAERGNEPKALDIVLGYGVDLPAGSGCVKRVLSRQAQFEALSEGMPLALVEDAARIVVVLAHGNHVVTAYKRTPERIKLRPHRRNRRKQKPRRRRRSQ